jgi:hypothetical protein
MSNHYKSYDNNEPDHDPIKAVVLTFLLSVVTSFFMVKSCEAHHHADSVSHAQYKALDSLYKKEQSTRILHQVQLAVQTQKDSTNKYKYALEFAKNWRTQEKRYIERDKKYTQIIAILTSVVLYLKIKN